MGCRFIPINDTCNNPIPLDSLFLEAISLSISRVLANTMGCTFCREPDIQPRRLTRQLTQQYERGIIFEPHRRLTQQNSLAAGQNAFPRRETITQRVDFRSLSRLESIDLYRAEIRRASGIGVTKCPPLPKSLSRRGTLTVPYSTITELPASD